MKKIIALMGPTACGKTDLAIRLSQAIEADIISVDSALVYRDMNIGTAKPSMEELKIAPHRLINLCDPSETYSAGQFCTDALREIKDIHLNNRTPILVGGTMLYFHKLLFGLADLPTANPEIRAQLLQDAEKIGWLAMHQRLAEIDPAAAAKIKPQDPQRIQRALEVFLLTGKRISELQKNNGQPVLEDYQVITIALIPEDRQWLHANIEKRFEKMLEDGFLDEVRALKNRGDLNEVMPSMRIVGYRQAWEYLEGKTDFETMKLKALAATRQLAKRQLTWLRSWKNLIVLDPKTVSAETVLGLL
ncbi:MAG: tRNA (adenosine(37)-N6)-dimethylallyltransferase MiaA [Gammaproteobacteria bacterium]|nr:tRNA (adenosine(37)-N6)-dimethylallyltransferase MiaA [Gammaproteobacteria bacterium]